MFATRVSRVSAAGFKNASRQVHKVKHKPRSEAFFPQYVNYFNAEDQAMFAATAIWGGLALAISLIPFGKAVDYPPLDMTGHIPAIEDADWGEWIGGNNGNNVEIFLLAAGIDEPAAHGHGHGHAKAHH